MKGKKPQNLKAEAIYALCLLKLPWITLSNLLSSQLKYPVFKLDKAAPYALNMDHRTNNVTL